MEVRQCGKCDPHRSRQFFDGIIRNTVDVDPTDAIMFLESD
jgi:hypothetical protein